MLILRNKKYVTDNTKSKNTSIIKKSVLSTGGTRAPS